MLIGEYIHTLDPKKRLALPVRFRQELGKKVVLTHGLDHCLFVYSLKEWQKISDRLANLSVGESNSRAFNRFMLAGAIEAEIDSLGRILIPDFLKEYAGLTAKAVVIGVHSRAEIWNEKSWIKYKGKVAGEADAMAQKLGEIGVI